MDIRPIEAFCSYSHKDERLRVMLDRHLTALKREGLLTSWYDRQIGAGSEWRGEIDRHLENARIILLLISPHFLASDYCVNVEMRRAMERHETGQAVVIPIFLSPSAWRGMPFGELQGLPRGAKPVTRWADRNRALANVADGLRDTIKHLPRRRSTRARVDSRNASAYYMDGMKSLEQRDYPGAVAAFDRALARERSRSGWKAWEYYHRGLAQYFMDDLDAAIVDWNHSIRLFPRNAFAFRQRANAYAQKNDRQHALADYRRAIALAPEVAKAYYNRGLLYQQFGDRKEALRDLKTAIRVGQDPEVERDARRAMEMMGEGPKPRAATRRARR
jgi:tetratricopeptide (TPR) repeat protein